MPRTLALAALALLCALPAAQAASIERDNTLGCRSLDTHKRLATIAARGDRTAVVALAEEVLTSGACTTFDAGARVRVEEGGFSFSCVAPLGSTAPCVWVPTRNVNVRG